MPIPAIPCPKSSRAFIGGCDFVRALENVHVQTIFLGEMERSPAAVAILKKCGWDPLEDLRRAADPDQRAARLRRTLLNRS